MDDNAYRLRAGHRLQLQIQSSDFPYFAVHPGTDENPWKKITGKRPSTQTVQLGGVSGARLTLPTITLPQD